MVKLEPNFGDDQFDIELFSGFQSSAFKDNCQQKDACFDFEHNMEATYLPSNAVSFLSLCLNLQEVLLLLHVLLFLTSNILVFYLVALTKFLVGNQKI